jgi:hypothetical protein
MVSSNLAASSAVLLPSLSSFKTIIRSSSLIHYLSIYSLVRTPLWSHLSWFSGLLAGIPSRKEPPKSFAFQISLLHYIIAAFESRLTKYLF